MSPESGLRSDTYAWGRGTQPAGPYIRLIWRPYLQETDALQLNPRLGPACLQCLFLFPFSPSAWATWAASGGMRGAPDEEIGTLTCLVDPHVINMNRTGPRKHYVRPPPSSLPATCSPASSSQAASTHPPKDLNPSSRLTRREPDPRMTEPRGHSQKPTAPRRKQRS